MKPKKQLPTGLLNRQEEQRKATIGKIREAVKLARSLEMPENNETLLELSGLKIGVIYKGHVQNCLSELSWGGHKFVFIPAVASDISREQFVEMQKQIQEFDARHKKDQKTIETLKTSNAELTADNHKIKEEDKILRGQIWQLQKKIEMAQKTPCE